MRSFLIGITLLATGCAEKLPDYCYRSGYASAAGWTGHRAATLWYPDDVESSLQSLQHLLENPPLFGPHRVEFDIGVTADQKLVVIHDKMTCRVSDANVTVAETDYADLPHLKDGSKIPLLSEYVDIIYAHDDSLIVEFDIKYPSEETLQELADSIAFMKTKHDVIIRLKTTSFNTSRASDYFCDLFGEVRRYEQANGKSCLYDNVGPCLYWCKL